MSEPQPAIVIDIDGVLVDNLARQRAHIAAGAPVGAASPEWTGFADGYLDDPPKPEFVELSHWLKAYVVLLTCRAKEHREVTMNWLDQHEVYWDELIMWDTNRHGYYEHKEVAIAELMRRLDVKLVIEDSTQHAKMFHTLGLPVILVPDGLTD